MFRTELNPQPSKQKIEIGASILSIGSCFAEVIGQHLSDTKFDILINPFGTIYNPISIAKILTCGTENELDNEQMFVENNGIHYHYDCHSKISSLNKDVLTKKIKNNISDTSKKLKSCDWLIITLGSAFVYELKSANMVVANCHKIPANQFTKRMLSVHEVTEAIDGTLANITSVNPNIKLILTVSPVRHTKDTLELNNLSKSTLRLACNSIASQYPEACYFPSFEIMMDDLRDYRFYKEDLIHPNKAAEEYIWDKFKSVYFSKETNTFIDIWGSLRNSMNHRAFHPTSLAHQNFIRKTIAKLEELNYPIDVSSEIIQLKSQLV